MKGSTGKGEQLQLGIKSKEVQGQIAGSHSVKYKPVGKGLLALGEKRNMPRLKAPAVSPHHVKTPGFDQRESSSMGVMK